MDECSFVQDMSCFFIEVASKVKYFNFSLTNL